MKKAYVKPQVYFENFQLSTSIAGGCSWQALSAEKTCVVNIPGTPETYIADLNTCTFTVPETNDKFCYHVPSEGLGVVFTS